MLTYRQRNSRNKNADEAKLVLQLSRAMGLSERMVRLLLERGYNNEADIEAFLHPGVTQMHDAFLFNGMDNAVSRIKTAIDKNERICVYGDYDADGVCATAILMRHLRSMNANVCYRIPSRHDEGYGMNIAAVEELHKDGVNLIITVDNGIKSIDEIKRAYELNMDAIVTDHHIAGDTLPQCEAIICHTLPTNQYPNKDLCGAGVAFKLVEALSGRDAAMEHIGLVGIATVADVVALRGENRTLVSLSLSAINGGKCAVGITELALAASDKNYALTARSYAFTLGPRINAAGRVEDASAAVELLICEDKAKAKALAEKLNRLNQQRQAEEAAIVEDAIMQIEASDITDKRTIVLKSETWNSGIVGIAAVKVAQKYNRPTLLLSESEGILTGSARSIPGVNLHEALRRNEKYFMRFGGHAYAAGLTMGAEKFDAFLPAFESTVRESNSADCFIPQAEYEMEAEFSDLTLNFAEEIALLEPFGEGNAKPVLRTRGVSIGNMRRLGTDGAHLRVDFSKKDVYASAICFYGGDKISDAVDYERCDILYTPSINEYKGVRSLQLELQEMRPLPVNDPVRYIEARNNKFVDALSENVLYNNVVCLKANRKNADVDSVILERVNSDIVGLLVLCFTQDGAKRFLSFANAKQLFERMDVSFHANRKGPCAYHAAVLAPMINRLSIVRYRQIVVYDTPVIDGIIDTIASLAPDAQIICADADINEADALLDALVLDRKAIIPFYRAASKREGRFYNEAAVQEYFRFELGASQPVCKLVTAVFIELGFLIKDEKGIVFVKDAEAKELNDSAVFARLSALQEARMQNHD